MKVTKDLLNEFDNMEYIAAECHEKKKKQTLDRVTTNYFIELDKDRKRMMDACRLKLDTKKGKQIKEEIERRFKIEK